MVSKLLQDRPLCLALTFGSLAYLLLFLFGIDIMSCPIDTLFQKPCPGCGLTRSVSALAEGDFERSFSLHALAIPYIAVFTLIGLAAILPSRYRNILISWVTKSEKLTHWPTILALLTLVYGLTRLFIEG
ncbi:DUF2752 domain-containing protein [Rubritalea sp.]|uniref:DUF2752 domain-containing protein n=1 Tax=Rubritalea sp. TaxID=2109375 RepID=UPI003EF57129